MADTAKVAGDTSTLHDMQDSNEHMDSLASAAGLMQLSSAAAAADAEDAGANGSSGSDASLPPGWQRIVHGSGLPCYVHDGLGVVCWTRPYPLDVGGDGALSQPELHRLVKQHVPPLSIFASSSSTEQGLKGGAGAAEELATASPLPTSTQEPNSSLSKKRKLDGSVRDRTVQVKAQDKAGASKQQSMSLREFKMLSIGDPRVLQACMELSIKTPAQVLQEYQNRNRGVSINYNTVPVEGDGVRLFKTIVTAGSTVAEGVASTKKIAKQLGAQKLLAILHERTARKYYEVADMYNSSLKGQPVISEKYGPAASSRNETRGRGSTDPRLNRVQANRQRRSRRPSPVRDYNGGGYREYDQRQAPPHWNGYNQQPVQHPQQSSPWSGGGQQVDAGVDADSERVVVYSTVPPANALPVYGGQYYSTNSNVGGNAWAGYAGEAPPPNAYSQQFGGAYANNLPPQGARPPYGGYGAYHSRSSDRLSSSTSTPIERVTWAVSIKTATLVLSLSLQKCSSIVHPMEGFLLVFSKDTVAQMQYCVLEHGMLRCYDEPDGELRDSVGLTRHRIRVQPLVSTDGLCPNRFVVHAMEVTRNDQVGAFVSAGKHEKVYCFAAATSSTMIKWANAIHNWRRHPFDDPTSSALSVQDTITSKVKRIPNTPTSKQRAVLLENQKAGLVCLASRFDVKLTRPTDAFRKNSRGMCMPPSFRVRSVTKDPAEMKTPRRSFTFTSWLPTRISSFRSSLSGV